MSAGHGGGSPARLEPEHYLRLIEEESARLVEVLCAADPDAAVPTCPGWTAADLLAHLYMVQTFWRRVVAEQIHSDEQAAGIDPPPRPASYAGLLHETRKAAGLLVASLRAAGPQAPAWTWAPGQGVAFIMRRQAHEAAIHRLDAEATAGSARAPIDATLATDGVDEALRVIRGLLPPWATATPQDDRLLRLVATDTGASWLVTMARITGVDPDGHTHDDPGVIVSDHDPADGSVRPLALMRGAAQDLYCRLWHRPEVGALASSGDPLLVAQFEAHLADPTR